jgi:hypothetical protein
MLNPYYQSAHWRALRAQALKRDGYRCAVVGCTLRACVVDHIETRPPVATPCAADRLDNLRCLCLSHDAQVKEQHRGRGSSRRSGGRFRVKGCDADGWPLDPTRRA